MKYVFVTGGPMSGIGKGIIASSIAMMFNWLNIFMTAIKVDGYLNYDADTMSPFEHGEPYVTADGGVTDLDLGNYERFAGLELSSDNSITMGKIYADVTKKERNGEYNGKTVQIVPHITDAIKDRIRKIAESTVVLNGKRVKPEVCIIEIGGTVGDMETQPVFHAIKQMIYENRNEKNSMCFVHVSYLSYVGSSDGDREAKTKPTQHNVELLRSLGISPDVMIMRCEKPLDLETREKLANHCLVYNVIDSYNVPSIHYVPQVLHKQELMPIICNKLGLDTTNPKPSEKYLSLIEYFNNISYNLPGRKTAKLAVVGKYTGMNDTYLSLIRAIQHGAFANNALVEITWIDAETIFQDNASNILRFADGILVPGGFGSRGIHGMMYAANYARQTNIPYFGICLGMQIMVAEYASGSYIGDVCYNSSEWCECNKEHAIHLLPGHDKETLSGQTMRLGKFACKLEKHSLANKCYDENVSEKDSARVVEIYERHRHRYEINNKVVGHLEDNGLIFSGMHEDRLCEIAEIVGKKFNLGCQFHPEFQSRYWKPHPLFKAFIASMI